MTVRRLIAVIVVSTALGTAGGTAQASDSSRAPADRAKVCVACW
ncbi:hypothetical protein [uncultured Phycicoccus sp.]|nr:hypothetical protein [uncultured Phycicoccus sp.]